MDLRTFLMQSPDLSQDGGVEKFASEWSTSRVAAKAHIVRQEDPHVDEIFVLDGHLISTICDPEGKEVCVGFYTGPCVVTPNIARTRAGRSLVSIVATTSATIARIDSDQLTQLMISSEPIRNWANGALREALNQKADREWCLAALGGADRLKWFRETYPGYEDIFSHALIASFLGITPVTLSRLRHH
ncbi:Crp/Fnr family transcriptional regulator [Yoonia sp. F2084L]|uniref:Crp/Fnr family transcriptional regulator n=1 Tax=Yoonia sp. F2084L TaxID=2926419 RepID=UPI001FF47AF3|nr:Crp/Fnr family transcriptional regulator [Yoonia sp. F2084L]MCK0095064.1 Crp/Fnr family transcriptional regulator [Yoonia sp. F2084L]